jgi:hypothetical protein
LKAQFIRPGEQHAFLVVVDQHKAHGIQTKKVASACIH